MIDRTSRAAMTGAAAVLALVAAVTLHAGRAAAGPGAHPIVVELSQSQGCSSCPPANALLNRLADRADLLPLSFAVTYWDSLGWKDTFARPAYTQRQWDFARAGGRGNVATPQFVVDGRAIISGSDPKALAAALRASASDARGPQIAVSGRRVTVGSGRRPSRRRCGWCATIRASGW